MADPTWKIAGALTLAHSLAVGAPASSPQQPSPGVAQDAFICSVIMMNNKNVQTATVHNPKTKEVLYTSTSLEPIEGGHKSGPAKDANGKDAGTLKVEIHPPHENKEWSQRPLTCSVDDGNGQKNYQVVIPPNVNNRLFMK